jgi:hypothetical protein
VEMLCRDLLLGPPLYSRKGRSTNPSTKAAKAAAKGRGCSHGGAKTAPTQTLTLALAD